MNWNVCWAVCEILLLARADRDLLQRARRHDIAAVDGLGEAAAEQHAHGERHRGKTRSDTRCVAMAGLGAAHYLHLPIREAFRQRMGQT
jgi:hypothetical protein